MVNCASQIRGKSKYSNRFKTTRNGSIPLHLEISVKRFDKRTKLSPVRPRFEEIEIRALKIHDRSNRSKSLAKGSIGIRFQLEISVKRFAKQTQ